MTKLGFLQPIERPVATEQITQQADTQQVKTQQATPSQPTAADVTDVTAQMAELTQADNGSIPPPPAETVFVETNVMKVALSNYGGGPVSLKLVNYLYPGDGEPVEMLPDNAIATPELKFSSRSISTGSYIFNCQSRERNFRISSGSADVIYTYRKDNSTITKRYHFYADRFDYDLVVEVNNPEALGFDRRYTLEWNNKLMPTELDFQDDYNSMWAMALQAGERIKFDDYNNDQFSGTYDGTTSWVATRSKYFAAVMIPRSRLGTGTIASGIQDHLLINGKKVKARELAIGILMEPPLSEPMKDSFSVYIGPMDYERLKDFNNGVVDIIDIGTTPFIGWIIKIFAIPIMWLLPRMYSIIPNYGLVIIIFSAFIKLITWPLSRKTVQSMQAMKEIQPRMKELQEKHKNNPQALNKEMMKLYKERGINPLSGCLPYLPQMPLFFALFAVFRSTILLRQAPFILWWDDLSRGALSVTDPYIILVVLMVALMFVQQKMTMTDPKNKALTYIMPLMLGFFFYSASAGLVLYWTCFSLFSFVEQLVFRKPQTADVQVLK